MIDHYQIRKVYEKLLSDLNDFRKCYITVHEDILRFVNEKSQQDKKQYDYSYGINYYIKVLHNPINSEELQKSLEKDYERGKKEIEDRNKTEKFGVFEYTTISPKRIKYSKKEERGFVDRMNYFLKYLDENFEIRIPDNFRTGYDSDQISIYGAKTPIIFMHVLKNYLVRVDELLKAIESVSDSSNTIEELRDRWMKLLSKNKTKELLLEMLEYFSEKRDKENSKSVILATQRYERNERELHNGTIDQLQYNYEMNKISASIIDILLE